MQPYSFVRSTLFLFILINSASLAAVAMPASKDCSRLLSEDELIDHTTQSDPRLAAISNLNETALSGYMCLVKGELHFRDLFHQDSHPVLLLDSVCRQSNAKRKGLCTEGLLISEMRALFEKRINLVGNEIGADSGVRAYGSKWITENDTRDIDLETLRLANKSDHVVLANLHTWINHGKAPLDESILKQIESADLDPSNADARHWVVIRNVVHEMVDGEMTLVAQVEDPDYDYLITGELTPVSPPKYGFKTWRFVSWENPRALILFSGLLDGSVDLDLE